MTLNLKGAVEDSRGLARSAEWRLWSYAQRERRPSREMR